jgi:hypothetical protein
MLSMGADFITAFPWTKKSRIIFKKLLIGCVLVLLMTWILQNFSELHAGQTYYYDKQGNLISEEEYEKLIRKNNEQKDSSTAKGEGSEVSNQPAGEDSFVEKEQQLETEDGDEEIEEDDIEPLSTEDGDEEMEEDDIEPLYQVEISSETIFRAFERDRGKQDDSVLVPAYQYLRLDLGALDEGGLSLHMYGWGRYDFNDSDHFDNNPDGELLYGYLEYNLPDYGTNFTLGRQHVMAGIINNSIDGLGVKSTLTPYFKYALYGGSPVGLSSEGGRSGDSFWGGRVAGHKAAEYEIGLSYKKKNSDGDSDEEMAGFDLFAELPFDINFFGFSSYNLDTDGWGEHSYEIRFDIYDFNFRPFYQRYRYEDFFNTKDNSANPFRFLADTGEILSSVGSDVIWQGFNQVDLGAKINFYDYDRRDENAFYFEGNANWNLNGLTQIGGQLGRMNGDSDETRYLLTRAFFYWNMPSALLRSGFISGDAMYVHYDEEIYGKNYSLWLSLGGGMRFFDDALEVKLSGDWSKDPFFDSNIRGLLKIQYTY